VQLLDYKQISKSPSLWFRNLAIDETTCQEIADIYQQVFKEDPEYPLARSHFK